MHWSCQKDGLNYLGRALWCLHRVQQTAVSTRCVGSSCSGVWHWTSGEGPDWKCCFYSNNYGCCSKHPPADTLCLELCCSVSYTTTSACSWEKQAPWEGGRVQGQHEESLDEAGGLSSYTDLFFICVLLQGCTSMARLQERLCSWVWVGSVHSSISDFSFLF